MTGPDLYRLGTSIIENITEGETSASDVQAQAALALACFTGAQAAAFAVMTATDCEDGDVARDWADAIGIEDPTKDDEGTQA